MAKIAIATLVRDMFEDNYNKWFQTLVMVRNQSIWMNTEGKFDFIFFYENHLHEEYRKKIKYSLPAHDIKFIQVNNFTPTSEERETLKPKVLDLGGFFSNYTSMCKFWSYGFLEWVDEYDYLIRIDDDCVSLNNIEKIFDELETKYLCYPKLSGEIFRTGLEDFVKMYFDKTQIDTGKVFCPYTNFCGFNLNKIRKDKRIKNFFKEIENNQFIHRYAWTDTLIWGIIMRYFLKEEEYMEIQAIKYIHLSHLCYVN